MAKNPAYRYVLCTFVGPQFMIQIVLCCHMHGKLQDVKFCSIISWILIKFEKYMKKIKTKSHFLITYIFEALEFMEPTVQYSLRYTKTLCMSFHTLDPHMF